MRKRRYAMTNAPQYARATDPMIPALLNRAVELHRQGRLSQAADIYSRIIALDPRQADAAHLLGVVLTQSGDALRGVGLIESSLALNPAQPFALANLGNAQATLHRLDAALSSYDRSIALCPDYAPAHNGRGSVLAAFGRLADALEAFDRALKLAPDFVEALYGRATTLMKLYRFEDAIAAFTRLLALTPDDPQILTSRALARCALWHYEESLADSDRALLLRPSLAEARFARCTALLGSGRLQDALAESGDALGGSPHNPELLVMRGNALKMLGRGEEARREYERALNLRADFPDALIALGTLETAAGRYDRAANVFATLLEVAPDRDFYRGVCLQSKLHVCDWRGYESTVQGIRAGVEAGKKSDLPFSFLSISGDPAAQLKCAAAYVSVRPPLRPPLHQASRYSHERLRVAYVSADFLEHPMAYLLAGVFEAHDRTRFEITAISLRADAASPMARRLERAFDRFVDVTKESDERIACLISELEVDIAVDLMGYTSLERPGILSRRPAPIQVNYIGYPATMAAAHIDYLVADRFVIPPAAAQFYSESIAYLPECFQANDRHRVAPALGATRSECGLPQDAFVWCAFHASVKINPPLFDVWCRLLHAVPDSVLWLVSNTATAKTNLEREAAARGIEPRRLVFAQREPYPRHLARLALADLCLDTWPFNGGATTSDALWCGVPVITRSGSAFSSRMSGSLLRTIGLPDLVTDDFVDYESRARRLATDRDALNSIRLRLEHGRRSSPLFDTDRIRRNLECAYTSMWDRHQRGEAPASFDVSP
jgi:predicted O-linked N-acetylglucosamine transferase (SPINDLY family)